MKWLILLLPVVIMAGQLNCKQVSVYSKEKGRQLKSRPVFISFETQDFIVINDEYLVYEWTEGDLQVFSNENSLDAMVEIKDGKVQRVLLREYINNKYRTGYSHHCR